MRPVARPRRWGQWSKYSHRIA